MEFVLCIILFILMIAAGGERGFKGVLTLTGNAIMLVICIYCISWGINVYVVTFFCSVIFAAFTLFLQNGKNKKTVSAIISVLVVMLLLTLMCAYIVYRSNVGGFGELYTYQEEANFLHNEIHIKSNDLITAVVILSLLGAIMDTSLSIATAEYEVMENNKSLTVSELIKSGNNIGKDILGTTINTLVFAGFGESLFLWMIFVRENYTIAHILNSDAFLQEFIIIAVANIGCLIIIPLTAFISAFIFKNTNIKAGEKSEAISLFNKEKNSQGEKNEQRYY